MDEELAILTMSMKEELALHLLGRMQEGVDGTVAWGGHEEVLRFLECLTYMGNSHWIKRCDPTSRGSMTIFHDN